MKLILYRVKQFFWHFNLKLVAKEKKYILDNLEEIDCKIFNRLSIPEQKHCIRVAIKIEEICENYTAQGINLDKNRLIRAALLHDVGKSYKRLNVIDKSIIVILDKVTNGKLKNYTRFKKVDTYYNHAEKGANILREYNYDERIIYLVENHHNCINKHKNIDKYEEENQDLELIALIYSDSIN